MRASNQSSMSFSHITKAATQKLKTRVQSIWFDANGEPKENYIWKISDNTPKGDAGEEIVGGIFKELYSELYEGYIVKVDIVGAEKGDYDVIVTVEELKLLKLKLWALCKEI